MLKSFYTALLVSLCLGLNAQVGVNNPSPTQALDVNGKVKVSDDNLSPVDGTLRYSDDVEDFQGYAAGEWKSLTKSATPQNVVPISYAHFGVVNDGMWVDFDRRYDNSRSDPTFSITDTQVPAGKILVVDQICATQTSGDADSFFYASVRPTRLNSGDQFNTNPQIVIGGSRKGGTTCIEAERAPILVVKREGSLRVWNDNISGGTIRVMVYGFFVDSLDDVFTY